MLMFGNDSKKKEDEARLYVEFVVIRNSPETAAIVMHSLISLSERQLGGSMNCRKTKTHYVP